MVLENFIVDAPIVWDRVGKKIFENPHVKQGRKMRVQITNAGMVEDLSGYTLALGWKHTVSGVDGLDVFEDSSEANVGIFEMAYTENLMTNLGNLKASLVLTSVEDMVVAESNDFYVKVDNSPFGADAEQGVGSYTRLAEILLNEESRIVAEVARVSAEETRVTDFNALVDSEIIAQNVATKLQAKEAEYLPRLVSNEQQLEQKVGGTVKAELEDLSATVLGAIDGTGGPFNLLSIPQDASVTPTKTTFFEYTKNLFDYKQAVFGKKVAGSGAVVDTIETDNDSYVTNVMPVVAGLPYVRNAYGNFAFLDADGLVIGSAVTKLANSPVTAPVGAVTMVSSLIADSSFPGIENVQIEQAESCTSFVTYGKLSYKQALDQNEVTLDNLDTALQDIVLQNLSADDYQPIKKYQAQVKNRTSVVFTDKQIKIHASFKFGEVKNERCIVVKDSAGNTIAHQWEDARNVNLNKNDNAGKYKDGSLRDGYLWIIDTCEASATNVYTVFVYPKEVTTITPIVSVTKNTTDDYTVIANGLTLNFLKAKRYLLESLNNNGTAETFLQRPAINNALLTLGVSPTFYLNVEPKVTVDKFEVVGSGVVFVEAQTTLRFYPSNVDLFSVLVKTRLYANGIIKTECVFKPLRTIAAGEITGVIQRVSLSPNSVITKTTDVTQISWTNTNKIKAILAVNTNGDTPRGVTPTIPELPANVEIVDNSGFAGTAELLLGWKYSNNANSFEIESGKPFTNQIEYNFVGVDSAANEKVRVLNELNGRINDETPAHLKSEILHETGKITRHLLDYYTVKYAGSYIDGLYPPTAAKLALFKLYGIGDLDEISDEYKATLVNRYGTITDADLWTKRKANAFSLDIGGRVFPLAYHFWQEYTRLGNATEKAYYENVISAYAEMLCLSTEQKGFVGLLYSTGYNSNSTATGLRGLAIGMAVFGAGYASGRWQAAYDTNKTNLNLFLRGANVLVDGYTQNLTISNYYHYAMYATYEYQKAVETKGEAPIYDLSSYAFTGSSAYGGLKEHKYCISSSRRGLPHTSAYVVNILASGNVSDLAQAKAVLQHFVSQNQPTAGISLPLEDFSNPPLNEKSELAICLGAFAELIFKLLGEKIA